MDNNRSRPHWSPAARRARNRVVEAGLLQTKQNRRPHAIRQSYETGGVGIPHKSVTDFVWL